jgi:hypothetical protein
MVDGEVGLGRARFLFDAARARRPSDKGDLLYRFAGR